MRMSRDGMVTLRDVATGTYIADLPHTSDVQLLARGYGGHNLTDYATKMATCVKVVCVQSLRAKGNRFK